MTVNPGATAAEVAKALGIFYNAARHHLDLLVEFGHLRWRALGAKRCYFENHGRYTPDEERRLAIYAQDWNVALPRLVGPRPA